MSTIVIVVLVVVIVALLAAGAFLYLRHRRSEQLHEKFGAEYEREVADAPNRSAAEKDLQGRQKRHDTLDIHALDRAERARYLGSWEKVQREFVDAPGDAVREADRLVIAVMAARGYPTDDFDQRADDVSVEHPDVVENYRRAHTIAVAHSRGDVDTEQLRQAAISYRALVRALLDDDSDDGADGRVDGGVDRGADRASSWGRSNGHSAARTSDVNGARSGGAGGNSRSQHPVPPAG